MSNMHDLFRTIRRTCTIERYISKQKVDEEEAEGKNNVVQQMIKVYVDTSHLEIIMVVVWLVSIVVGVGFVTKGILIPYPQ